MENNKKRLVVLVSDTGNNLQALVERIRDGTIPDAEIVRVISSKAFAYAVARAKKAGIECVIVSKDRYPDPGDRTQAMLDALAAAEPDLIILAEYANVLEPDIIKQYERRIINIHPSMVPKYCGKGLYGDYVHQAVLAAGETETGATVHFVDEGVDTGEIILQWPVPVEEGDDLKTLSARVRAAERQILPEAIRMLVSYEKEDSNHTETGAEAKTEAVAGEKIGLSADDYIDASVCDAMLARADSGGGVMSQSAIDDMIRAMADASKKLKS